MGLRPSDREGRLLFGGGPARRVRTARFGFSWPVALSLRKPPLMRVGFPWISLDSLVRIETYQWVTRYKWRKIFSRAFPPGLSDFGTGASRSGSAELPTCSWGKFSWSSDYLQGIVAAALFARQKPTPTRSVHMRSSARHWRVFRRCASSGSQAAPL